MPASHITVCERRKPMDNDGYHPWNGDVLSQAAREDGIAASKQERSKAKNTVPILMCGEPVKLSSISCGTLWALGTEGRAISSSSISTLHRR